MKFKIVITVTGREIRVNPDAVEFISEGNPPAGAVLQFILGKVVSVRTTVQETQDILEGDSNPDNPLGGPSSGL